MAKLFEYDESRTKERRKRSDARMQRSYRASTPVTPIPRRASASSSRPARARTRQRRTHTEFQEGDITRLPTIPRSATRQGEIEHTSFPSMVPDDQDRGKVYRAVMREAQADICELATKPPPVPFQPHRVLALHDEPLYRDDVVEADTVMDDTLIVVPSLPTDVALYATRVEDVVDVALTVRARQLLRRKGSMEDRPAFIHNPVDYIRWWLLSPGRLEFLFWLGGALLLGIILCVVLVVTGLGLGWMSFGHLAH